MKQAMKGLFSIALLVSSAVQATDTIGGSFLLGGLGTPASNSLIEHADRANKFDAEGMYAVFSSHSEYGQTFKSDDIAKYLFFNGTTSMVVGPRATAAAGTSTAVGGKTDVFATHLLLGTAFDSIITAAPTVKTFASNINLFIGLGDLWEGLYVDFSLPIIHTKWDIGLTETSRVASTVIATNTLDAAGAVTAPYTTAIGALKGDKIIGDVTSVMSYHKIDGAQSKTKVGDTKAVFGYNFINKENCHFGVGLLGVFNGNGATTAEFAFEPNVGTAGRHGVGGRVDGHVRLYEKDEHSISAHIRADVFTTFKRTMRRTYDFTTNGVGSRYTLLKQYTAVGDNYAGILQQSVNISSIEAKIAMDVVYNADLMLHYTNGSFVFDLGYGLNGHSKEVHKEWVGSITPSKYGFWEAAPTDAGLDPVSADNDGLVSTTMNVAGYFSDTPATNTATTLITEAKLNTASGLAAAAMTHAVYGNLGYTWEDSEWAPMVAVGGGARFSGSDNNALNSWNVHFTGGVSF